MMHLSKYTFLFEHNDSYFIYSTLSTAFIEVDLETYELLQKSKKENIDLTKEVIGDDETYELLTSKYFITENEKDDFLIFKSVVNGFRSSNEHISITIAPTMDCNYRCFYCFENNEPRYITSEVIDSIVQFVVSKKEAKSLSLTWFGGEPLMAIDKMKEFYDKLTAVWDKEYSSNIITNGYYITPENIEILKAIKVSMMQISIDGKAERHNSIKFMDECKDTFNKTLENIDLITKTAPEINVTIRVNIDKNNADDYIDLYKTLSARYQDANLGIGPGIIQDRSEGCRSANSSCLIKGDELTKYVLDLFNKEGIYTGFVSYPKAFFNECNVRNDNTIAVDPEGNVYKCWEYIGKKKYTIGKLESDGSINITDQRKYLRFRYGADPIDDKKCSSCAYIPICNGGCPMHRIENEFEDRNNDNCTVVKGHLPEFLKIHLKVKEAQARHAAEKEKNEEKEKQKG